MEPPILWVVREGADDHSSSEPVQPAQTGPDPRPLRWTLPMSRPQEETGQTDQTDQAS